MTKKEIVEKFLNSKLFKEYVSPKFFKDGYYVVYLCGGSTLGFNDDQSDIDIDFVVKSTNENSEFFQPFQIYYKETGTKLDLHCTPYKLFFTRNENFNEAFFFAFGYNQFLIPLSHLSEEHIIYDETNGAFFNFIDRYREKITVSGLLSSYNNYSKKKMDDFILMTNDTRRPHCMEVLEKPLSNFLKAAVEYFNISQPSGETYENIINMIHYKEEIAATDENIELISNLFTSIKEKMDALLENSNSVKENLTELDKSFLHLVIKK